MTVCIVKSLLPHIAVFVCLRITVFLEDLAIIIKRICPPNQLLPRFISSKMSRLLIISLDATWHVVHMINVAKDSVRLAL